MKIWKTRHLQNIIIIIIIIHYIYIAPFWTLKALHIEGLHTSLLVEWRQ